MSQSAFLPTRREIVLLFGLLMLLLVLTQGNYLSLSSNYTSASLKKGSGNIDSLDRGVGVGGHTYPVPRFAWKDEGGVPETKLATHAPGESRMSGLPEHAL